MECVLFNLIAFIKDDLNWYYLYGDLVDNLCMIVLGTGRIIFMLC
jgi:hypothetical protein